MESEKEHAWYFMVLLFSDDGEFWERQARIVGFLCLVFFQNSFDASTLCFYKTILAQVKQLSFILSIFIWNTNHQPNNSSTLPQDSIQGLFYLTNLISKSNEKLTFKFI